jgi:hypothetical protein
MVLVDPATPTLPCSMKCAAGFVSNDAAAVSFTPTTTILGDGRVEGKYDAFSFVRLLQTTSNTGAGWREQPLRLHAPNGTMRTLTEADADAGGLFAGVYSRQGKLLSNCPGLKRVVAATSNAYLALCNDEVRRGVCQHRIS